MALAETIIRLINKYGVIPKAIRYLPIILFLVAMALIAWIAVLPMEGQYRNTYISENALMPAQANLYFRELEWNHVRGYRLALADLEHVGHDQRSSTVRGWLDDIGLVTETHANGVANDLMYGVMHAPRGDDTEAMVLVVPWYTADGEYNLGGAALGLALMRYFARMLIWLKNVIVVFPELLRVPLRRWVEAYHTSLPLTAGAIDAAIVIEYASANDYFDYYEMLYEGLNGQLPNLDLLNTANHVAYHEGIHQCIQKTPNVELTKNDYYARARTFVRGIKLLALAGLTPQSSHGGEAFSGWQIQAFTLRAVGFPGDHDITQFGRVVDLTFRLVNNLLEKFHQSFFFYLLMLPRLFVSIGTYLPAAVLTAVSFALASLGALLGAGVLAQDYIGHITTTLTAFTAIEALSYALGEILPRITPAASAGGDLVAAMVLVVGGGALAVLAALTVVGGAGRVSAATRFSLIGLALFYIAMLITALLIVHFALALLIGLATLPLTFVGRLLTTGGPGARVRIALCLIASNPFIAIAAAGYASGDGPAVLMRGLLTAWPEVQCWTWYVVVLGWLPAWLAVAIAAVTLPKPVPKLKQN